MSVACQNVADAVLVPVKAAEPVTAGYD